MDLNVVTQIVTVALAALAIIWHQQRIADKLRDRLDNVAQRLARIEGFLGIGMPAAAASDAPGATLAAKPAGAEDHPKTPGEQRAKPAATD